MRHQSRVGMGRPTAAVLAALALSVLCASGARADPTPPPGFVAEQSVGPHVGLSSSSDPVAIAPAPASSYGGAMWFTSRGTPSAIGWINLGAENGGEYSAGLNPGSEPYEIAPGAEGDMWFTDQGTTAAIGRVDPIGGITEFSAGLNAGSVPDDIALGADGDLWFTDDGATRAIGRITPAGQISEFSAGLAPGSEPTGIAPGPDGAMWFTDQGATRAIGRITPAGQISEYTRGLSTRNDPTTIAPGPDGAMWFTDQGAARAIGRISTGGDITEYSSGLDSASNPNSIALGPDGNLWFTDAGGRYAVGRITPSGAITEFPFTDNVPGRRTGSMIAGGDGNLWFTDQGATKAIGRAFDGFPYWEFGGQPALARYILPSVQGSGQAETPQRCIPADWADLASQIPSATAYPMDGYSWFVRPPQRAGAGLSAWTRVGSGVLYTPPAASTGLELECVETVTYPLLDLTYSAEGLLNVTAAPAGEQSRILPPPPPSLTAVHQSSSYWREGGQLARISSHRPPVGTTFSFALSQPATVGLNFTRRAAGRLVGGRCRPVTRADARRRPCQRSVSAGTVRLNGHAGSNRVSFDGRMSRAHRLRAGRHGVIITAVNSFGGRSKQAVLTFTIAR